MKSSPRHNHDPDVSFDGGDLDCGGGLLLLIRKNIGPLKPGQLLEVISSESSVEEDLPAWCRLTNNDLLSMTKRGNVRSFLISKGPFNPPSLEVQAASSTRPTQARSIEPQAASHSGTDDTQSMAIPFELLPFAVMGIGSWPRPSWLLRLLHEQLEDRLSEEDFQTAANEAVRLAISEQVAAGVDVVTDGEQRRDSYASFIGRFLENCQLVPLVDLLPLVDDPEKFQRELQALDVPAEKVMHPAVFGKISAKRSIAVRELQFARTCTTKPVKVALPGPYLLTRTMWMDCFKEKAYESREAFAEDIIPILQNEILALQQHGAVMVQLDEPVLTEIVFGNSQGTNNRTFMCGALGERREPAEELEFALKLINRVAAGCDRNRLAMHICRGNWTTDESAALTGSYEPLLSLLQRVKVGTIFLEFCTPRAGDMHILDALPKNVRVGIGVVNPKHSKVESVEDIIAKAKEATKYIRAERLILTPDCGFATFADNPLSSADVAQQKLKNIALAAERLRS